MSAIRRFELGAGVTADVRLAETSTPELWSPAPGDLVFIFGWRAGPLKTIDRIYGDMYLNKLGFHVVTVEAPHPGLWGPEATREFGKVVTSDVWRKLVTRERRAMFHDFSNGGLSTMYQILKLSSQTDRPLAPLVVAQIFDSAPIVSGLTSRAEFQLTMDRSGSGRTLLNVAKAYVGSIPWYVGWKAEHAFWDLKTVLGLNVGKDDEIPYGHAVRSLFFSTSWPALKASVSLFDGR